MTDEEALEHFESASDYLADAQTKLLDAARAADSDVLATICEDEYDLIEDQLWQHRRFVVVADDLRTREDGDFDELEL